MRGAHHTTRCPYIRSPPKSSPSGQRAPSSRTSRRPATAALGWSRSPRTIASTRSTPTAATGCWPICGTRSTGIVAHHTGTLVISGPLGHEGWRLLRIRDHGYEVACDVPGLLSGNGMAWVDQRLLIADSLLGLVLSIDPARGRSSVWLVDELLTKTDPASPLPGVNGVAAGHESHVGTFRSLLGHHIQPLGPGRPTRSAAHVRRDLPVSGRPQPP